MLHFCIIYIQHTTHSNYSTINEIHYTHAHIYIYIYVLDFPQKVCTALGYSLSGIEPTIASINTEHTNKALEIHGVQCATI